jgi:hypothetical protein
VCGLHIEKVFRTAQSPPFRFPPCRGFRSGGGGVREESSSGGRAGVAASTGGGRQATTTELGFGGC